jgi:hypothetical protein
MFDSTFDLRLRIVPEQLSRFCDVGKGLRHVAWLKRLAVNLGRKVELFFD